MDIKDRTGNAVPTASATPTRSMPNGQRIAMLVIGDIVMFIIFATLGRRNHGEAAGINAFLQIVLTALPFAIGWFIVSPFIGAFRRGLELRPGAMARRTFLAWICSWPIAMALRSIFVDHSIPPLSFFIVVLIVNSILLVAWRTLFATVMRFVRR